MLTIETYIEIIKPMIYLILFMAIVMGVQVGAIYIKFKGSLYNHESGNSFRQTLFDRGCYGEFLTFIKLEKMSGNHKLLVNIYLPKADGTTTEIDLLMIHETGLYVFESKNYSGWIFGDEKNKMWTQSLKGGKKHKFYNPIWQNKGHILVLDQFLKNKYTSHLYSYIVFSERCELKKVNVDTPDIKVMKRNHLIQNLKRDMRTREKRLTQSQIEEIYRLLASQTTVDEEIKRAHIKSIQLKQRVSDK